ncbi:MAG TPA: hypothetical protein VKX30_03975 [Flavobacteriaceae bacterium]|nr:hypothetical protein [Flavobacteriaceae bacterium]
MRAIYTYLFVFLYLGTLIRPILPVLEYGWNYEYISKVLCINTDKPELKCDGKCYLTQEIQKTFLFETTDDSSAISIIEIGVDRFTIAFQNTFKYTSYTLNLFKKVKMFSPSVGEIRNYIPPVLHPPEFLI